MTCVSRLEIFKLPVVVDVILGLRRCGNEGVFQSSSQIFLLMKSIPEPLHLRERNLPAEETTRSQLLMRSTGII